MLIRAAINELTAKTISHLDGIRDLRAAIKRALITTLRGRSRATNLVAREIYQLMNLGMVEPA
jgi:hypothetical protein